MSQNCTRVNCSACHRRLKIRGGTMDGIKVRCPNCSHEFFVGASASGPPAPPVVLHSHHSQTHQERPPACRPSPPREDHPPIENTVDRRAARQRLAHPSLRQQHRPRKQRVASRNPITAKPAALAACAAACLFTLAGVYAAVASDFRIWKNSRGQKSKIKMSIVDSSDSKVRLKREDDGREFDLPISRLSPEDRDYVRKFKTADEPPTKSTSPDALSPSPRALSPRSTSPGPQPGLSAAGDFAQWRGAGRDGVVHGSTRLANTWLSSGPRQLWTSDETIPSEWGGGWGSVAVAVGRVYVYANICPSRGATGPVAQDIVFCLDADSGQTLWQYQHDGGRHNSPSNSTPAIDSGRCYVHGSGGMFYCLDARSGRELWVAEAMRPASNETSSSFAIAGEIAVVMSPHLTGINTRSGEIVWTRSSVRSRHSSPALWQHGGANYAVCHSDRGLFAVDVLTGEVAWQTGRGGGESSPVVVGDVAIQRTRDQMIAYDMIDSDATERWRVQFGDEGSSPLVYDGHVYAIKQGGEAICVRLSDGSQQWRSHIRRGRFSSPVAADGKVFMVLGSELYMLSADAREEDVLDHADLSIESCTSPAIADGKIFVRQRSGIACYDLR